MALEKRESIRGDATTASWTFVTQNHFGITGSSSPSVDHVTATALVCHREYREVYHFRKLKLGESRTQRNSENQVFPVLQFRILVF